MISIGHTAAGYIVGTTVVSITNDPVFGLTAGVLAGLASHYFLDFLPHGHFGKEAEYTKISTTTMFIYLDVFGGGFLFAYLTYLKFGLSINALIVLLSIFAAILPDIVSAVDKVFFGLKLRQSFLKSEHRFHTSTHWHGLGKKTLLLSFLDIWQVALIIFAIFI